METKRETVMFALLVVFWALNYPLVKIALAYTTPFDLTLLRLLFSIPFLAVLMPKSFIPIGSVKANLKLFIFGVLDIAATWGLWYAGEAYVSPSLAVLIMYTYPVIVVVLGAVILKEKLTLRRAAGVIAGFLGLFVVFSSDINASNFLGPLLILASAISWSFGVVFYKAHLSRYNPATVNTYQLIYALPVTAALALGSGPFVIRVSPIFILTMIVMAFPGTAIAFYIYVSLYSKNEVGKVTPYLFLVPATSVVFSYILLGSRLTWFAVAGLVLLSIGVLVSSKG